MSKGFPPGTYGDIHGYQPKRIKKKLLAKLRMGLSAANPAEAMLLVKEIDQLVYKVRQLEEEVALYKDREEHLEGMGVD